MDYTKHTHKRNTPQTEKVPGVKKQKRNNAGGVSFKISKWDYMLRFLILGTEGGTYYVRESKLTKEAAINVEKCINKNPKKAIDMIVDVSISGRSVNNDAAIFALALAASSNSRTTRVYALKQLPKVCRIGTHLFHFVHFTKSMRGWGRALKDAVSKWYTSKGIEPLTYQMLKYQQRDGWSHRDILRLAHPTPTTKEMNKLFSYVVGKRSTIPKVSPYARGMRKLREKPVNKAPDIIRKYSLTREVVPTEYLNSVPVWEAMLDNMPITALVRNLGKMSSLNMHKPFSASLKKTIEKLSNKKAVSRSRIHPIAIANAYITYRSGKGLKGSLRWEPNGSILDVLEEAFYTSFDNVEPCGKNIMLALDVSGSMTTPLVNSQMSCREASAVLAMVTMRSEPYTFISGFTGSCHNVFDISNSASYGWMSSSVMSEIPLNKKASLSDTIQTLSGLNFGATDCALPMLYCLHRDIDVDAIVIYTDNETWIGDIHPWQALDKLQQRLGHSVKLIVVGMTATGFSIARPDYPNMLDVVGFDTSTPQAVSEFIKD